MAHPAIISALSDDGAAYDQLDRHRNRTDYSVSPTGRLATAGMVMGRYAPKFDVVLVWEYTPSGRHVWMMPTMHRIYLAVKAEMEAGHDLTIKGIALLAQASRGYVSKCIKRLRWFGFIDIVAVVRGRLGRIVARVAKCFHPPSMRGISTNTSSLRTGGNIKPDVPWWNAEWDTYGSFYRALNRV